MYTIFKGTNSSSSSHFKDSIEFNLMESTEEQADDDGPAGNILGAPVKRLIHFKSLPCVQLIYRANNISTIIILF